MSGTDGNKIALRINGRKENRVKLENGTKKDTIEKKKKREREGGGAEMARDLLERMKKTNTRVREREGDRQTDRQTDRQRQF